MAQEITELLQASGQGDQQATDRLFKVIYSELRVIAKSNRRRWIGNETLNTTALINEAFLKLNGEANWASRTHFYATAAKAMRHILVSYAEQKNAAKRGGGIPDLPLDKVLVTTNDAAADALSLHQALNLLEQEKPRWGRIVECRFFGGMSLDETALALNISAATVGREWKLASAWLYEMLKSDEQQDVTED